MDAYPALNLRLDQPALGEFICLLNVMVFASEPGTPSKRRSVSVTPRARPLLHATFRDLDLACNYGVDAQTDFLGRPCAAGRPSTAKRGKLSTLWTGSRADDRQQLLKDVAVMVHVPFAGKLAVRVRQPVQEAVRRIQTAAGLGVESPAVGTDLVYGHLPQPRSKRPLSLTLKTRNLTNHHDEDLLSQVVGLRAQAGDSAQPAADQRQVNALQAVPVGASGPGRLEPIQRLTEVGVMVGPDVCLAAS